MGIFEGILIFFIGIGVYGACMFLGIFPNDEDKE